MSYDQKIKKLKAELVRLGFKVRARNRKLAHIERMYFKITGPADHRQFMHIAMPAIRKHFPGSHMTSGGFFGCSCDCTVALID